VITGVQDQVLKLIRIETGEVLFEQEHGMMMFSPDGNYATRYKFNQTPPFHVSELDLVNDPPLLAVAFIIAPRRCALADAI
jgi:hypothetical protein